MPDDWKPLKLQWEDSEDDDWQEGDDGEPGFGMSADNTAGILSEEWYEGMEEDWGEPFLASFCIGRDASDKFYVHESDSRVLPPPHFIPPPFDTLREAADWCERRNEELSSGTASVYGTGTWVKEPIRKLVKLP